MNYEWTIRLIQCSDTLEERRRRRSNPADEVGIGPIPGQLPIRGCWTGINWESAVTVVLTGFNFSTFSLEKIVFTVPSTPYLTSMFVTGFRKKQVGDNHTVKIPTFKRHSQEPIIFSGLTQKLSYWLHHGYKLFVFQAK